VRSCRTLSTLPAFAKATAGKPGDARAPAGKPDDATGCPVADRVCSEVLSLPLYPSLRQDEAVYVASSIRTFQD
jgi:dTDP-4-amino-4,6-dideoxygalactose transaminase